MSPAFAIGQGQWVCEPNFLTCAHCDALFAIYKSGFRANLSDIAGAVPYECQNCKPATYFMAIFSPLPTPLVTCYPLSRESYLEWAPRAVKFPPTSELLYHLKDPMGHSFNPYWRPASNRRTE